MPMPGLSHAWVSMVLPKNNPAYLLVGILSMTWTIAAVACSMPNRHAEDPLVRQSGQVCQIGIPAEDQRLPRAVTAEQRSPHCLGLDGSRNGRGRAAAHDEDVGLVVEDQVGRHLGGPVVVGLGVSDQPADLVALAVPEDHGIAEGSWTSPMPHWSATAKMAKLPVNGEITPTLISRPASGPW